MKSLKVDLGARSYPIYIGSGLLQQTELLSRHICSKQVVIVTNETIAPLYLESVVANLAGLQVEAVILPDGEQYKTLEIMNRIFNVMLENRLNRNATLIALGGGVIGDIAGFVASTFKRGLNLVQVPTSLLAQVDSAIGGKTGVNLDEGKNLVGTFYQPHIVVVDVNTLNSLPSTEFVAGLAEVIKYGVTMDLELFQILIDRNEEILHRDPKVISMIIERV